MRVVWNILSHGVFSEGVRYAEKVSTERGFSGVNELLRYLSRFRRRGHSYARPVDWRAMEKG